MEDRQKLQPDILNFGALHNRYAGHFYVYFCASKNVDPRLHDLLCLGDYDLRDPRQNERMRVVVRLTKTEEGYHLQLYNR